MLATINGKKMLNTIQKVHQRGDSQEIFPAEVKLAVLRENILPYPRQIALFRVIGIHIDGTLSK